MGLIFALIILATAQPSGQSSAPRATCDTIDNVDLMNSELNFESSSLQFKGGKACTADGGSDNACDWEHTVTLDKVLMPEQGQAVRLIIINSNHLTGSGAWDHVLLLECKDGKVTSLFNGSYLNGAKVETLSDGEFSLISGEWLKKDPECCPSRHKREIFRWDRKKSTFTVSEKTIHN